MLPLSCYHRWVLFGKIVKVKLIIPQTTTLNYLISTISLKIFLILKEGRQFIILLILKYFEDIVDIK